MPTATKIIDHFTVTVRNKQGQTEYVRVEGTEANNKTEARRIAKSYGKVEFIHVQYQYKD